MSLDPSDDLDRIRSAREGSTENSSSSAILKCPIEGCSRIIANGRDYLMHHVRQSSDEAHSGLELNDELEVVERGSDSSESDSSKKDDGDTIDSPKSPEEPLNVSWGPGDSTDSSKTLHNRATDCTW
jgi:hypothetical protein